MSTPPTAPETLGSLSDETQLDDPNSSLAKEISGKSPMQIALGRLRRDKIAVVCAVIACFFVLVAIFAGVICKIFGVSLETPFASQVIEPLTGLPKMGPPNHGFDPNHPLGVAPKTGEDNLAYWVYGCRTSLIIAGTATLFSIGIGILLGLISGYVGGAVDKAISFVTDFFLTIPFLLAALTVAPIVTQRFQLSDNYFLYQKLVLIAILGVFGWMGMARLIRGEVLSLREREFVMAAKVLGMSTPRIMMRELLPNLAAPIIISTSLLLPAFVAAEAGLAYLGIGVTSGASWGQTIDAATKYYDDYPLYLWAPMVGIIAMVLSLNLLGDAVRDALDPKTRR